MGVVPLIVGMRLSVSRGANSEVELGGVDDAHGWSGYLVYPGSGVYDLGRLLKLNSLSMTRSSKGSDLRPFSLTGGGLINKIIGSLRCYHLINDPVPVRGVGQYVVVGG